LQKARDDAFAEEDDMSTATLVRALHLGATAAAAAVVFTTSAHSSIAGAAASGATQATPAAVIPAGARLEPLVVQSGRLVPPSPLAEHARRRAAVEVSARALAAGLVLNAQAHVLQLFPDVQVVALRSRVESRSPNDYTWFGYVPGDQFGRAIITVIGGRLGALLTLTGRRYVVVPVADALHEVLELNEASFPRGDDVGPPFMGRPGAGAFPTGGSRGQSLDAMPALDVGGLFRALDWKAMKAVKIPGMLYVPDLGPDIDVMVAFTHTAAAAYGGLADDHNAPHLPPWAMVFKLQLDIDEANQSFLESGVPIHLNLIGDLYENIIYHEADLMFDNLVAVRDGGLPDVHAQRDDRAADLVVFLTGPGKAGTVSDGCGRSSWIRPLNADDDPVYAAANGYLVVRVDCLVSLTLAHEIGHQLGAKHDHYTQELQGSSPTEPEDARGYAWHNGQGTLGFYTIMAYDWSCRDHVIGYALYGLNCHQVSRWSDPDAIGPYGQPLGQNAFAAYPAHDAKAIENNLVGVANYRRSVCRLIQGC
jgi:hypothetical protein